MASATTSNLLIDTIKRVRKIDSHMAYAYAFGMLSIEVSEKTMQEMVDHMLLMEHIKKKG